MAEPTSIALVSAGMLGTGLRVVQRHYQAVRPYVDWGLALVLFVLLAPLIGLCALLVKLTSRGPAFYSQERVGLKGKHFTLWKIRSMCQDAEAQTGPKLANGDSRDPRVTPVGRVLRRTHLDELPQLLNVLRGEMSLIGPRPERPYFVQQWKEVIPQYEERLQVKPGITGLAQVRAGYDSTARDVKRKVKLDLLYIHRMCWWVDITILWRTLSKAVH